MQRGLVCSLTNEYATFDEKCTDFEADETAIAKELTKQREYKEELQKTGGVLTGSNWFLWIGVLSGKHGKIDPVGTDEIDPVKTA